MNTTNHEVRIQSEAFDPWGELQRIELQLPRGKYGANAVFVGYLRDFNENAAVQAMSLEHYPGMTERYIGKVVETAASRWALLHVVVVHRVGQINVSDPIVLVAVWSAHRAEAFDACRFIINDLKSQAPFWKHERRGHENHWVEQNNPDLGA